MIAAGEDHALDAAEARRLVEIAAADDVGLQDLLPRSLDGKAAEVNDPGSTLGGLLDSVQVRQVGLYEGLALVEIGDRLDVRQAQGIAPGQLGAQEPADAARRPGHQDRFHG